MKHFAKLVALVSLCTVVPSQDSTGPGGHGFANSESLGSLYAVTKDGFGPGPGELVGLGNRPPWTSELLTTTDGGLRLRYFKKFLYVVNGVEGTITRVKRNGTSSKTFHLGVLSKPQDILVHRSDDAWVTRLDDARLARLELSTGELTDSVDLSILASENESIALRSMIRDGSRLFVQVGLTRGDGAVVGANRGMLAVVDLNTATLIDTDPVEPGTQGIALLGAPPNHKMQIVERTRTLFVSTTLDRLDNRGGIEMIDLEGLVSRGYALTEEEVGADLGGFVMTSPEAGYFVFHTDIIASTHLKSFTLESGPSPGPELFVLLGDFVDVLVHDPDRRRLYIPSGFSTTGTGKGVYVLSTVTNELVDPEPIVTPLSPHDVVLVNGGGLPMPTPWTLLQYRPLTGER